MGIHNTNMYEKAIVAMAKQSVTLEVLSYHASASMDDAGRLRVCQQCGCTIVLTTKLVCFSDVKNTLLCLLSTA